ncbi:beta-lactamase family protein, partial [candidate division KSB1 bacterium]|nr:beta-lactamase family protein [candidate division KSB1 bacterium]
RVFGLALLLALSLACKPTAIRTTDSLEAFVDHLDQTIPRLMDRYNVPGLTLALVRDGQLAWSDAWGFADLQHKRRMEVDAVCRVESISKSVTAWGVMRLVEQGLIDLDDPVEQHLAGWKLPESEFSHDAVTIRRLLSNSAGMPLGTIGEEYAPQSDMPSLQDYLSREARLVREPGTGFIYANTGFNLLELLVQEVSGRDFADTMADEVLHPLGMHTSGFVWNEAVRDRIPTGYDLKGNPVPAYVYPAKASGGLYATVEDVARFVAAGIRAVDGPGRPVLHDSTLSLIYTPRVEIPGLFGVVADAYGFGHFLETLPDGRQAVWHGGQGHGWMTHFHSVPESGDGIVILTNSQRSWPLMARVLDDWAKWSGLGSVKMSRITLGIHALQVLIAGVVMVSLIQLYRLVRGLFKGTRRLAPLSLKNRKRRMVQAALGLAAMAALLWAAAQPYLMLSSVFPGIAELAGIAFFVLAIINAVSAGFPSIKDEKESDRV